MRVALRYVIRILVVLEVDALLFNVFLKLLCGHLLRVSLVAARASFDTFSWWQALLDALWTQVEAFD
jgi:hypothetical protein